MVIKLEIDKVVQKFNETADMQEFCSTQQKLIIELSKQVKFLEEKNSHLEKLIDSSIPIYTSIIITDEETISREQLKKLKSISDDRELTLEECKKVDVYTKILIAISSRSKTIETSAKHMSESELIQFVNKNE